MLISFAYPKPYAHINELQEFLYLGQFHNISSLSVPISYIEFAGKFDGISKITGAIDFPEGSSPTEVRVAGILYAAKQKIRSIDLVARNDLLSNGQIKEFKNDIRTCSLCAAAKGMDLNVILEYIILDEVFVLDIIQILKDLGIKSVITATGRFEDDLVDNLIISSRSANFGMRVATASNTWTWKTFNQMKDRIGHIRFTSLSNIKNVLGNYIK